MRIKDNEIRNLKIGEVIYECEAGMNIETRIIEQPTESEWPDGRKQWRWRAVNTQNGKEIDYLMTEGLSHYGPRLYLAPQYGRFADGDFQFPLLGTTT